MKMITDVRRSTKEPLG